MSPPPQRPAFTLVEVLLAVSIFALGVTVLATSAFNAISARLLLEEDQQRAFDARLIRQQVLTLSDRKTLERGGDIPSFHHDELHWEATLDPTPLLNLFALHLRIDFPDNPEEETLYILRPGWAETSQQAIWQEDARRRVEASRPPP